MIENDKRDISELLELLEKEIQKLPAKCKQVFLLSKKEGLTHIEISEHLNISVKTIENHMTRAFKILRNKLGEQTEAILFLLFGINAKPAL